MEIGALVHYVGVYLWYYLGSCLRYFAVAGAMYGIFHLWFRREWLAHRIQASMSRVGNPYDNAKAESFMKTLKHEEVDGRDYRDVATARGSIAPFLEEVYNRQRLHSALGYRSPVEFEASLLPLRLAQPPAPDAIAPAP